MPEHRNAAESFRIQPRFAVGDSRVPKPSAERASPLDSVAARAGLIADAQLSARRKEYCVKKGAA